MVEKRDDQIVSEIDYEMFGILMHRLTGLIQQKSPRFSGVYGVERGGVAVGLHLSHHLGIPYLIKPQDGCLVADDIADSGKTLKKIKDKFKNIEIATLHYKEKSVVIPDFWVEEIVEGVYIRYPWEKDG